MSLDLPAGLTSRPLVMSDARAVFEVMAAQELHDTGEVAIEEADIVGDWQRPSYDVSASTFGVFDGDVLVAYAEHMGGDRGDAAVHPDHRGRGIGTALAGWMQARARAAGASVVGMPVPRGSAGDRLLEALGYQVRWESWVLQLPEGATVPDRTLPAGYTIREATPDDHQACWTLLEDAFLEWSDREREPYEDFLARTVRRPGFEPWNLRLVVDPDGNGRRRHAGPPVRRRRGTSTGWPPAPTSAAAASPRRCSSMRSPWPARTARRPPGSTPTPAPAPSASTRRSA